MWDIQIDPALNFALQISKQTTIPNEHDNKILSKHFISPRGDRKKFIMINLIYNKFIHSFTSAYKANLVFYVLMYLLQEDVQMNYIPHAMYYHNVNEVYELTTNGKYNELIAHGQGVDSIINVDLYEFDIENFEEFVFKINGVDTDCLIWIIIKLYTII